MLTASSWVLSTTSIASRGNRGRCGFYGLTNAVHVTAALLRFWVTMKGLVWAAARDGER